MPPNFLDELKEVVDTKFNFDLNVDMILMTSYANAYAPKDLVPGLINSLWARKPGPSYPLFFGRNPNTFWTRKFQSPKIRRR